MWVVVCCVHLEMWGSLSLHLLWKIYSLQAYIYNLLFCKELTVEIAQQQCLSVLLHLLYVTYFDDYS